MACPRVRPGCFGLALAVLLTLGWSPRALAQDDETTLEGLLDGARDWMKDNVDDRVIGLVDQIDVDQLDPLLRELQRRFQGEYVLDLASLRASAVQLVDSLAESDDTRPYAEWLRARLDYFEVADEFRVAIPPPPVEPGKPAAPPPNPAPPAERKAWRERVAKRPLPKQAESFVTRLKPVFAAQKLPPELVWLAEVESSFNPEARSPVGAAGLYQLMPATAKAQGLSLKPRDERLDPERNAEAAARYLRYLYPRFKDWRLTLAAYNAGESRVDKLLKQRQGKTFDDVALHLPAETQMYVPKFEAILLEREGIALARLKAPGE